MNDLPNVTDWELWANVATVVEVAFVVLLAFLGWLWRTGRWIFRKERIAPPPPPDPPLPFINPQSGRPVLGRNEDVRTLGALLTGTTRGVVLSGQGGFGKSTLARHYVEAHGAGYHGGIWVGAETRQSAINGLCAACETLGLETPEQPQESHAKAVVAAIARQVAERKPWLLIFDNVETRADVEGLLPAGAHILVTTRQGQGWAGWAPFGIETLPFKTPEDPGPALLMQAAERADEPEAARALAEALGGLPLALVLMGGFLKAEGMGFAEGEAHLKEAMARAPMNEGYPTSLLGAVRLSYEKLSDDSKIVAQLCSYWAPEGLGPGLIADAPGGLLWDHWREDLIPEPVQSLAQDPARIRAAFAELSARSLLTGTGEARAMHRMTALALREIGENALAPAPVALLAAVYPEGGEPSVSSNYPLCARLTPHVRALLGSGASPEVAAWVYLLNQAGLYLNAIADYQGRLPMAEENLRIEEARLTEADRGLAVAHANLGVAYLRLQRWVAAEAALRRAVALNEEHRPGSADLADSLDLLGFLLGDHARTGAKGRLPEAAKLHQRAIALRRCLFGRRAEPVAAALNNLGGVRFLQRNLAAAARLQGASLSIRRDILPADDTRLATGCMNVGSCWLKAGEAAKAEPLLREALAIREAAFAEQPQHPERRTAADWLILCLLVRARAGVNRGVREAEAKRLCAEYGFDFAEMERRSRKFPDSPQEAKPAILPQPRT